MAMLSEGIIKLNSKILETSELKKFDKQEKEGIAGNGFVVKGKDTGSCFFLSANSRDWPLDFWKFMCL